MTLQEFRGFLLLPEPPDGIGFALAGLWWDAKGDWNQAHQSAQPDAGTAASWVHAYLHHKEDDSRNAQYWYGRAGKIPACISPREEWLQMAETLLGGRDPAGS